MFGPRNSRIWEQPAAAAAHAADSSKNRGRPYHFAARETRRFAKHPEPSACGDAVDTSPRPSPASNWQAGVRGVPLEQARSEACQRRYNTLRIAPAGTSSTPSRQGHSHRQNWLPSCGASAGLDGGRTMTSGSFDDWSTTGCELDDGTSVGAAPPSPRPLRPEAGDARLQWLLHCFRAMPETIVLDRGKQGIKIVSTGLGIDRAEYFLAEMSGLCRKASSQVSVELERDIELREQVRELWFKTGQTGGSHPDFVHQLWAYETEFAQSWHSKLPPSQQVPGGSGPLPVMWKVDSVSAALHLRRPFVITLLRD